MWWIPLATAAVSAYMGHQQQKAQNEARKEQSRFNAWAPLFNQAPKPLGAEQDLVTPAAMQGAMTGYQMMAQHQMNEKLGNFYDKMSASDSANPNASVGVPVSDAFAPTMSTANLYGSAPAPSPFMPYFDPNNLLVKKG